jgi:DNA-binding beta-propeller fold protein YncE
MPSLRDRFHDVDVVDAPDVWDLALRREPSPSLSDRQPQARRVTTILVASAIALLAIGSLVWSFSDRPGPVSGGGVPIVVPDDPCDLLTAGAVERATGGRVLSWRQLEQPDMKGPTPDALLPCEYSTDSRFGSILVTTDPNDITGFVGARDRDPRQVSVIDGLGDEAFVYGKGAIWVRVGGAYFSIGAQLHPGDESVAMLTVLAHDAIDAAAAPPLGWIRHTDETGVSIDTPAAWEFNSDPVPGVSPPILFAAGTGPVPSGGECAPTSAVDALPADGALFAAIEYDHPDRPSDFPPRPEAFDLGPLLGPFECWGVKTHLILFEDEGRYFQIHVVFGPAAPASLHEEVLQSLGSLQVESLSSPTSTPPAALRATQLSVPSVFGVATTAEDVWLASYGHVLRVDRTDKLIASIPVSGLDDQDSIAASDSVWVTVSYRDEVIEIDPSTNAIRARIPVPGHPVQIAADPSGVWVISATKGAGTLVRIDPMTRTVTLRVPLSGAPKLGLAVGESSVWVDDGGNLLRVTSDGTRTTLRGAGGDPLAIGSGSVWEGNSSGVIRLDPTSGVVLAQIPTALPPIGLAFADGSLWVLTDTGSTSETIYLPDPKHPSTVLRIDTVTNRVDAGPLAVGTKPAWVAASGADAWVANFNETRLLKIEPS